MGTSNEEGSNRAVLQVDDVLTRLKNIDLHVTRNILWLWQTMLDHASSTRANLSSMTSQPSSPGMAPS